MRNKERRLQGNYRTLIPMSCGSSCECSAFCTSIIHHHPIADAFKPFDFGLYAVPEDVCSDWMLLGVDLLFRSFLDWSEIYGVQMSSIELDSMGGRHLFMILLLTIDFILIQGLFRVFEISRTISRCCSDCARSKWPTAWGRAVPICW